MERSLYKVYKIQNGTVIDHIPSSLALKVIEILGHDNDGMIAIGMNLDSSKLGKKDLIKYENKFLEKDDTDKLALIAPGASINIIKDAKVVEKRTINLPKDVKDVLHCKNPNCITNLQSVNTRFEVINENNKKYRCYYCEKEFKITPDMVK